MLSRVFSGASRRYNLDNCLSTDIVNVRDPVIKNTPRRGFLGGAGKQRQGIAIQDDAMRTPYCETGFSV